VVVFLDLAGVFSCRVLGCFFPLVLLVQRSCPYGSVRPSNIVKHSKTNLEKKKCLEPSCMDAKLSEINASSVMSRLGTQGACYPPIFSVQVLPDADFLKAGMDE
jgi:hypothetical protein